MARISTYDKDVSLSGKDKVVGSNYVSTINSVDQFTTTNFTLEALAEYFAGQITTDPVQLSLKSQGGLVIEVVNNTNFLAVNLDHTNITGTLANTDLENSSITINGTAVSLGGSISVPIGDITQVTAGTYLSGGGTTGDITINHDDTTRTNSTSTASPAYGATFTAIDTVTTNATGHVTAVNTKTVTLPSTENTTYDLDLVQSTNDVDLTLDASTGTDTTIKFKAGSNVTLTKGAVGGVEQVTIASQAFGTVHTVNSQSNMIAATSTSGDIVIRTDVNKTFIHNGGSAGDATDFTELQFSGINSIDLTEGDGITLSRTGTGALTNANNDLTVTNALATTLKRGGIKIGYTESGKNYPVELDSEKAFVNVPWANTNQLTEWVLTDDDDDNTTINHGKHVKFVMATGALGTNTTGAGTDADPYLVTLTSPDSNTTYTAGNGLDLTGTEFSHTDTSSQASVDNSGRTYIQDITLDTYGHVTGLVSATETVTDTNRLTTWDLLDDDDDSFTINHDKHVKFTSGNGAYGTNITGAGTSSDPYVVAITSPNDTVPDTTYGISCVNGDNNDEEKIRLTDSGGTTDDVVLEAGTGLSIARSGDKITFTNEVTDTTNWNFKVDSGTAENIAASETVTFTGGTNVTLTQNGKTIDIAATDNNDNTTYTTEIPSNTTKLRLVGSDSTNEDIEFVGTGATTVTRTNASKFTIDSTDNNTQRTDEDIRDVTVAMLTAGTNITLTEDDTANTLTIDATDTTTNYYLDGITKSGNKLIFSVNGATNQEYTFGSNAFNSTTIPTNNNQITNGAGYTTNTGTTTADNTQTFTNKSGNISQWTNDSGYLTSFSETDTLATVTGRGASTTTDTTFNSHLTVGGAGHWLYVVPNTANTNPTHVHGMALGWNYSGGSRESNIIFAAGSDATAQNEADCQIRFQYKPVSGSIDTIAKLWSGGNLNIQGYLTVQNGGNTITNTKVGQWSTAYGWGDHGAAGYLTSFDITTQTDAKYLRSDADDTSSGDLTVVSYKFNGNASNPTNTTATIYDQSGQGPTISGLNVCFRTGSTPSQTGKLNSSGTFTVSGDVVAYGSPSDISLKENIKPIENALDKVEKLQGVTFDWKDKQENILHIKEDIGFIAQDVQKVLPELVRKNENGKLSLRHQGVIPVLLEAIKELREEVKQLKTCNCNGGNG